MEIIKYYTIIKTSPGGGIGRHKGLKIPRRQLHAGSSPALGTTKKKIITKNTYLDVNSYQSSFF